MPYSEFGQRTLSQFGRYLQAVEPSVMTVISTWRNHSQLIMFLQPIALTTRACESVGEHQSSDVHGSELQ